MSRKRNIGGLIETDPTLGLTEAQIIAELERENAARAKAAAVVQTHRDANPIYYVTKPPNPGFNPLQERLLQAWLKPQLKTFAYTGGNRIGKTTTLIWLCISTMTAKYLWDGTDLSYLFPHNKPRKVRLVGQDWEKEIKTVVVPAFKEWWPQSRKLAVKKNSLGVEAFFTDEESGSTLELMSNKQESMLHEGWHGDLIAFDEPPKRDVYVANSRGLIDRGGREFIAATLLEQPWIHTDIIKKLDEDGRPDRRIFAVDGDMYVNVGFGITEDNVNDFKSKLTPAEIKARVDGKPAYLEGLVCSDFDRHIHIKDRYPIPSDWLVDFAFDIHPRKEQAVLAVATNSKNERVACFEIWEHGDGTSIAEHVIRLISRYALRANRFICDPLAKGDKNNDNTTFDKIDRVLNRHGHVLETACKDKTSGIIEINNHLKGLNNEPSLWFFHDMRKTIEHIEKWMYDKLGKPSKVDDDFCENLYRLLLLDTEYEEADDYNEQPVRATNVDPITGW